MRRRGRRDPGSSPLARGLHPRFDRPGYCGRIIPARAGFTTASTDRPRSGPDHPRSRGVYSHRVTAERVMRGSSPLARGLRSLPARGTGPGRIIPARAGFTARRVPDESGEPDHPRSRGVYPSSPAAPRGRRGSSPLARGLLVGLLSREEEPGSSPLARGLLGDRPEHAEQEGIIPARAGFTGHGGGAVDAVEDHPRSRGVYPVPALARLGLGGSSPLARGLPGPGARAPRPRRIIPARAGFTFSAS